LKTIILCAALIFFQLLACPKISNVSAQQAIIPETFNFSELAKKEAAQSGKRNVKKEIDGGWRYLQKGLPFPVGAVIKKQGTAVSTTPNSIEAASPPPLQTFLGHVDPLLTIPPDSHGTVGIDNVVTATNDYIIVHAKNGGAVLSKVSFATFFNNSDMSDPYMQFDPYLNKYWISGISTTTPNKVFIAVSQTGDPAGIWFRYSFTPTSVDGSLLLDHPYLGFDNKLLVVTGRKFPNGANFSGPILFVFNKASLAAGNPISFGTNAQTIEKTTADGDVPCPVTALGLTSPATVFYILQNWNGSNSAIRLSTITGNIPSLSWNTTSAVFPSGGSPWSEAQLGNLAPQADESRKLAVNDARISSAQLVNGKIWCAHHIGLPATGADHTAVQWWQLSTAGDVLQRGRIDDPAGLVSRYYPTIAVNPAENVLIGYTVSSPTTRVNAAYSTRTTATALNTTDDEYVFKGGISTYWKDYGSGRARWGDYSHSSVDPVTGDLWTIQEYAEERASAADNDSKYGVWWADVSFLSFSTDASVSNIIEPNNIAPYCTLPLNPKVTIKNVGTNTLTSVKIGLVIDGVNAGTQVITGLTLGLFASQDVAINVPLSPAPGAHLLEVYTFEPNGIADQRTSNDTASISFSVEPDLILPHVEGFENPTFPPPGGWSVSNPDGDLTWDRTTDASKSGVASMTLNIFNYSNQGAVDIFKSPKITIDNVDSVNISFDVAYARFDRTSKDSLQVVYSTDCGVTWNPAGYNKGGAELVTNGGFFVDTSYIPDPSEWRHESVSLATCGINSHSILIGMQLLNDFGNNIYVDNLAITKTDTKQSNAAILSIDQPASTLCTTDLTPAVTIANYGFDTLKALTINYRVDNGPLSTFIFTGALPRCTTQLVTLTGISTTTGNHVLTVFSSNPNGLADQSPQNDTASKAIAISPTVSAPVAEGFENAAFPPENWTLTNPDGLLTWEKTTSAARSGTASMVIRNFDYPVANSIDRFLSPVVKYDPAVDSFFLSFDYAYAPGVQYPGSTAFPIDTLEVDITQDCGQTFTPVWKKWGIELQTINEPNSASGTAFIPNSATQWRNINLYLNPVIGTGSFQAYFVAKSNRQNNLYLDNLNIYTKKLPQRLKEQGYLLYPNPFSNSFIIRHYHVPTTLRSIAIFNSVGQMVWERDVNGTANTEMTVDLPNLAAGVYIVKLNYLEKTVVQRIVKQ
jgi:Secretion system C-terminal sorting domain/CARDB